MQLAEDVAPAAVVVLPLVHSWHWGFGAGLVPPEDQVPRGHIVHGLPPLPLAQIAAWRQGGTDGFEMKAWQNCFGGAQRLVYGRCSAMRGFTLPLREQRREITWPDTQKA
mgnify:CR=1 FL=1